MLLLLLLMLLVLPGPGRYLSMFLSSSSSACGWERVFDIRTWRPVRVCSHCHGMSGRISTVGGEDAVQVCESGLLCCMQHPPMCMSLHCRFHYWYGAAAAMLFDTMLNLHCTTPVNTVPFFNTIPLLPPRHTALACPMPHARWWWRHLWQPLRMIPPLAVVPAAALAVDAPAPLLVSCH